MKRHSSLLMIAAAASLSWASSARAVECPAIAGGAPALAALDVDARLQFIRARMRHSARRARIWSWTWASLYATSTVVNAALIPGHSSDDRINDYFYAGSSALGVAAIALLPLKVIRDQPRLEARITALPIEGDRCALLAEAESMLVRDAAGEAFSKGPLVIAGSFAFNVGIGLTLAIGFDHTRAGALFAGTGVAVSAIQFATQPADLGPALAQYRRGDLSPTTTSLRPVVATIIGGGRFGLSATWQF